MAVSEVPGASSPMRVCHQRSPHPKRVCCERVFGAAMGEPEDSAVGVPRVGRVLPSGGAQFTDPS